MATHSIIKITTPLYTVVYVQGSKFDERQEIIYLMWIQLGMYMIRANLNIAHIHRVFITPDDCTNDDDKNLIVSGGFPNDINDLSDELKKLIFESKVDEPVVANDDIQNNNN
jgi:hypothetical protein